MTEGTKADQPREARWKTGLIRELKVGGLLMLPCGLGVAFLGVRFALSSPDIGEKVIGGDLGYGVGAVVFLLLAGLVVGLCGGKGSLAFGIQLAIVVLVAWESYLQGNHDLLVYAWFGMGVFVARLPFWLKRQTGQPESTYARDG